MHRGDGMKTQTPKEETQDVVILRTNHSQQCARIKQCFWKVRCLYSHSQRMAGVFCFPWTRLLVVGGGDAAGADTSPMCVAAWAVANESTRIFEDESVFSTSVSAPFLYEHLHPAPTPAASSALVSFLCDDWTLWSNIVVTGSMTPTLNQCYKNVPILQSRVQCLAPPDTDTHTKTML
jgi:hypothetical protein